MRAFQRTSNHDRTTDQSFFIDKSLTPPTLLLVLDHASLVAFLRREKKRTHFTGAKKISYENASATGKKMSWLVHTFFGKLLSAVILGFINKLKIGMKQIQT